MIDINSFEKQLPMAGAGAGGGNNPHQDKAGFFSASQPFTFNEEHLAAKVEEERRVSEWREGEGREAAHNTLWTTFQQTAAALTQLYRQESGAGGSQGASGHPGPGGGEAEAGSGPGSREWQPFQAAAGQLTMLYRDSLEEMRKANEGGRRSGYQKARSDLVTWIRSRRGRNISRAELLAFLARDQELEGGRVECVPPGADPATQHALLQMFETSREEAGGGRKRSGPGDPDPDNESESEMESPQSKRSRFL